MTIWFILGSLVLSASWLLPNHYLPWSTFHSDAWMASLLLILCGVSLVKIRGAQAWSHLAVFTAILCVIPIIQLITGQLRLAGTAYISSLYLLGFLLAMLTGARWQSSRGDELVDSLFLAIGVAATVSVGVALCQWLGATEGCLCSATWVLPPIENYRIGANLAQANQLATLLLLGILSYVWAWTKQIFSSSTALLGICFLLVGLVLTESRMGVVALGVMLIFAWLWRSLWFSRQAPYIATVLFIFFIVMYLLQDSFTHWLLLDYKSTLLERTKNESRIDMWLKFGSAALQQPWWGYGWNQSVLAQLEITPTKYIEQDSNKLILSYAHNLFIDLVLWLGIPLGLLTSAAIITWLLRAASYAKNSCDAILVLAVVSTGVHAMLEFPLYYAYFLLPLGLMIGTLDSRLQHRQAFIADLRFTVYIWIVCSVLFVIVVRDYFVVEQSYAELRQDAARIANKTPRQIPDVLLLTQLRDYIALARLEPTSNLSQEKIEWVKKVALVYPAEQNLLKLATVLALNGQTLQASQWIGKLCNLYSGVECARAGKEWRRLQLQFPQLSKVEWPKMTNAATTNLQ